ncbi:hypothetical protein H4S01_003356 [Coemansia sp. RSA 2610]|nr:hypothetical protein H4S01_003356 [Coemansia sp. RSA 2610]
MQAWRVQRLSCLRIGCCRSSSSSGVVVRPLTKAAVADRPPAGPARDKLRPTLHTHVPAQHGGQDGSGTPSATRDPWAFADAARERTRFEAMSGGEISEWLHWLRLLYQGVNCDRRTAPRGAQFRRSGSSESPVTKDAGSERPSDAYIDLLSQEQLLDRELVLAQVLMLKLKRDVARGRHRGSSKCAAERLSGWQGAGDLRATQIALLVQAHHWSCPGLVLNLLLDWKTGAPLVSRHLLDKIARQHFGTSEQLVRATRRAQAIYKALVLDSGDPVPEDAYRRGTATGFVDRLWYGNSLHVATDVLRRLAGPRDGPGKDTQPADQLISSLAIRLMHAADDCGQLWTAHDIFAQYRPWLHRSVVAYTILLHAEAMSNNMRAVVDILKQMRRSRVVPDPHIWTEIIDGLCRHGKIEAAKKLFSLHLLFVPRNSSCGLPAVTPTSASAFSGGEQNLWGEWFAENPKRNLLDPFIWSWMHELAYVYQNNLFAKRNPKGHQRSATPVYHVKPWLPTLVTHRIMAAALDRAGMSSELSRYCRLLKHSWPLYRRWLYPNSKQATASQGHWDGFQGIERIALGHMAQHSETARAAYQLGHVTAPAKLEGEGYYAYCEEILALARNRVAADPSPTADAQLPPRSVYVRALRSYALDTDIYPVVHHMRQQPWLNDIAVWTDLVRCITAQISRSPDNPLLRYPQLHREPSFNVAQQPRESWLDFIFELFHLLAARGVHFDQTTFGLVIRAAARTSDLEAIFRVLECMRAHSTVRLNVGMLVQLLEIEEVPFAGRCELVLKAVEAAASLGVGGHTELCHVAVRPNPALVTRVIQQVQAPDDLARLIAVLRVLREKFGLALRDHDLRLLRTICTEPEMRAELRNWTQ